MFTGAILCLQGEHGRSPGNGRRGCSGAGEWEWMLGALERGEVSRYSSCGQAEQKSISTGLWGQGDLGSNEFSTHFLLGNP